MGKRGSFRARQRLFRLLAKRQDACWLGLEPLDFSIADKNDMGHVEIDEKVPVGMGGDPLDPENCALACRFHNLKKGCRVLPAGAFAYDERGLYGSKRPKRRACSTSREW